SLARDRPDLRPFVVGQVAIGLSERREVVIENVGNHPVLTRTKRNIPNAVAVLDVAWTYPLDSRPRTLQSAALEESAMSTAPMPERSHVACAIDLRSVAKSSQRGEHPRTLGQELREEVDTRHTIEGGKLGKQVERPHQNLNGFQPPGGVDLLLLGHRDRRRGREGSLERRQMLPQFRVAKLAAEIVTPGFRLRLESGPVVIAHGGEHL